MMKIASFFAGCGGLDLGFENAGFDIIWANEFDKTICPTYVYNHPNVALNNSDIRTLSSDDIPDCDGFIGGPPCQSWSEGGLGLGINDERGKVFLDYIRLIKEKKPKFFLIENVPGILSDKHKPCFDNFISTLISAGYNVKYKILNTKFFKIPQDRSRVFIVGTRKDLQLDYIFPDQNELDIMDLRMAIGDIENKPKEYVDELVVQEDYNIITNHDVYMGGYDSKYMARNRVRNWHEVSFTIQAQAKNEPIHPQAPKMQYISSNKRVFRKGYEHLYRRLSVRECARIQSFPDSFKFIYSDVKDGYKMVGNAVPPKLSYVLAESIKRCIEKSIHILVGYYKGESHLNMILKNKLYYFPRLKNTPTSIMYIYLHHKSNSYIYRVKPNSLSTIDDKTLHNLGFHPTKEKYEYLLIDCLSEISEDETSQIKKTCSQYKSSYEPKIVIYRSFR
ncbi:DNA cytosine methyltransferase [Methanobrevibacter sp.]|uniref:DNA cytosine methyltransferase n=1 Tax=Methanobrevibacter sp. TaxID=66852 RepID=UPI0038653050